MKILMAAAECRGWAKVGGLADVVRELSEALAAKGHRVSVILPRYESLSLPMENPQSLSVRFGGIEWESTLSHVRQEGVDFWFVGGPFFEGEYRSVYIDSGKKGLGPFEDDAKRFAYFCAAIMTLLESPAWQDLEVLHCHDWHTGILTLMAHLRRQQLPIKTVFTIHNLDYQGIRPWEVESGRLKGFSEWFPGLFQELDHHEIRDMIMDPRYPNCFNPMRCGLNLADEVNTVSPTYAKEITRPDDPPAGFIGGRGLEEDLARRKRSGRLSGILNGIDYRSLASKSPGFRNKRSLFAGWEAAVKQSVAAQGEKFLNAAAVLSHAKKWASRDPELPLVVMVTRAVEQKLGLLMEGYGRSTVLGTLLELPLNLAVIGTGDWAPSLEIINSFANGMFLNAFSPDLAESLYACGDLFLMPSDFEPCGISQMIALFHGNLPLVHDRGGLHDTVIHLKTGFVFAGSTREDSKKAFLDVLSEALDLYSRIPETWKMIRENALKVRFTWDASVEAYEKIYTRS